MIQAYRQAQTPNQRILEGVRTAFLVFNFVACPMYLVEISLLGHWLDSLGSKIPYFMMVLGFIFTGLILWNRRVAWVRNGFLLVMILLAITGIAGLLFHVVYNFDGKVDWSFESVTKALQGDRPVLAPLAFAHIGLTGLLCMYKAD